MNARGEYEANKEELHKIARSSTEEMAVAVKDVSRSADLYKVGRTVSLTYHDAIEVKALHGFAEIGRVNIKHYASAVNAKLTDSDMDQILHDELTRLYDEKYHNLTLSERWKANRILLQQNLKKSAVTGEGLPTRAQNVVRLFTSRYPYGAHINVDQRMFLSESVRLEHNIARYFIEHHGDEIEWVVWKLSHQHKQRDICDMLASRGPYKPTKVPTIPHPNCRCTLHFKLKDKLPQGSVKRTGNIIRQLLKRIGLRK